VIADVYVNADGHKKSITSPGVGNYVTFAKAVKLAEQILGTQAAASQLCACARNRHSAKPRDGIPHFK
jgi:hypothetical protein